MDKKTLWRVTYARNAGPRSDGFSVGPWHPDRAHVERCAARLAHLMAVGVQSNLDAASGTSIWPVRPAASPRQAGAAHAAHGAARNGQWL